MIDIIFLAMIVNWGVPIAVSLLFMLWLCWVSHDIRLEGWVLMWGFVPVARFRLISKFSWYARMWNNFYGQAMFLSFIHRDDPGVSDDGWVKLTIIHELRHVAQLLVLGLVFWVLYGLFWLVLWVSGGNPYRNNPFEVDARKAANRWLDEGAKPVVAFGKRY